MVTELSNLIFEDEEPTVVQAGINILPLLSRDLLERNISNDVIKILTVSSISADKAHF